MRRLLIAAAVMTASGVTTIVAWPAAAQQLPATQERPLDPIVAKWDTGVDKIDVAKYPADMKKKYKTFAELCSKCHTLARAVNCDFVLDDEWERYIKKMMRRGRGVISPDQGLEVFEFLTYDAKIRKRELYEKKLAANR